MSPPDSWRGIRPSEPCMPCDIAWALVFALDGVGVRRDRLGVAGGAVMKAAKAKPFATESALCAAFLKEVGREQHWIAYPETAGWDILLVRKADGFQIGIQAKLKLGVAVINQTLEDGSYWGQATRSGPDCRAILVPTGGDPGFDRIAAYIGFTIIRVWSESSRHRFDPDLPDKSSWHDRRWHELCPTKRHDLPEYVPDVEAGASAPIQLTEWKIGAIKIAIILERRGFVTRKDFDHIGIDHRRWIAADGWLRRCACGYGWFSPRDLSFRKAHPRVYGEIAADFEKWSSPRGMELAL